MTPKEKAEELVYLFSFRCVECDNEKISALTAVDQIIESRKDDKHLDDLSLSTSSEYYTPHPMYLTYWLQVKQEIEKL